MGGFLEWVLARRLVTLAGFGVILLGAFVPWPNLAIAAVVIVLGTVLLAIQIPSALRNATEELDGVDVPEEQWQPPAYPQYQAPEPYQQPAAYQTPAAYQSPAPYQAPAPSQQTEPSYPDAPALPWQPKHIPQYNPPTPYQPEPSLQVPSSPSPQAEPQRPADQPATPWRPQNIPHYPQPER